MNVFHSFQEIKGISHSVVALGTFDGVHRGHRKVMEKAMAIGRQKGCLTAVVTFAAHPLSILAPEHEPLRLATVAQKTCYIEEIGIDALVLLPMNRQLIDESPDDFCRQLIQYIQPSAIVVGANFTYGSKAAGNTETLRAFMSRYDIPVHALSLLERPGKASPISSTAIRKLVCMGHMETAALLLGRPFEVEGIVVKGDRRGRTIGFPTANMLLPPHMAMPPDGVYATRIRVDGTWHRAMTNIGDNPTFSNQYRRIETNVFDWQGCLYGKTVSLRFYKRIRGEERFDTTQELIEQMDEDKRKTLIYFSHK
ncbi:bifunctional riboflavin kinase/FAD synthetase [Megasphaera vaginalis (ex Srinivasan et al. 2021)]|uniref:Riboflavin biosynthesis protein n=1 Tax=Megasphaera vaginalis (ex Srinivasan et al. 2021) TaxID=1111454 RepID=U7UCQ6_9FIRM|nr:bifunctional riboflavin kinase/FAD synthetase [Megasphaera vaginalis (ex Srinivasan et al. 2021)]ERT57126.1 riboflavin biosynthesis protein RibF [Megasphaera vaginalis (ex Srinivasan et al. 2021)]